MRNLNIIAEELFNKIRGRFPSVTIGNAEGKVTNIPKEARYYDFDFKEGDRNLGKVSVSIDEENIAVMYSNDFVTQEDTLTKNSWYDFLKEIRVFAKKRMLSFDTRDINKSNLDKRDYQFLAANRNDITMESMMYGTSKTSYQNIGGARLAIKHSSPVNPERRTHHVSSIYIESAEGERFKYPYKHLNGARAMARHVAEGGTPYDEFGKHVTGLSEELAKLKKFKSYMGRSAVMAESLKDYVDVVKERANYIKKEITNLQKSNHYKQAFESFEAPILEDVPVDVAENWIDQLTIKQFNEELKDVFPYIYKLVSEATKAKELGVDDLISEEQPADSYMVKPGDTIYGIAKRFAESNYDGDIEAGVKDIMELNNITDPESLQPGQKLDIGYFMGGMKSGATRGLPSGGFKSYDEEIDAAFEQSMGQFKDMEIAPEKPQLPVTEYIMSMYDRETGNFPKGETAVLTAVEKDYGEEFIEPSKNFIERMTTLFAGQNQTQKDPELAAFEAKLAERNKTKKIDPMDPEKPEDMMGDYDDDEDIEETGLQYKTGVDKHGKEYMVKAAQAGREGASQEEIGALRDKYSKAEKNKTSEEVNRIKHLSGI